MQHPGRVVSLWTAPAAAAPMSRQHEVMAIVGRGLEGDRYANRDGTFSGFEGPRREVTLISREEIDKARLESGLLLEASDFRRNIVCTGVDLHTLMRKSFSIGEVTLRGITTAGPCGHLARLVNVQKNLLVKALPGIRCGLRAQVIYGGKIREGDEIVLL